MDVNGNQMYAGSAKENFSDPSLASSILHLPSPYGHRLGARHHLKTKVAGSRHESAECELVLVREADRLDAIARLELRANNNK
jgi:hypothetical protein